MRRATLFALVLVAVTASPVAARGAAEWKVHRGPGFTVSLPSSWADASADRNRILAESQKLVKTDPELSRIIDGLLAAGAANSALKMFAFDLAPSSLRSGFATNLNVLRESTEKSLAEWRRDSLKALASMSFVRKPIWSQTVKLAAGKAVRIRYRARFNLGTGPLDVSITQYGLVKPGFAYVLTYTTLPSLEPGYRASFERSARSFRLGG